jgi:hypothetical protein
MAHSGCIHGAHYFCWTRQAHNANKPVPTRKGEAPLLAAQRRQPMEDIDARSNSFSSRLDVFINSMHSACHEVAQ